MNKQEKKYLGLNSYALDGGRVSIAERRAEGQKELFPTP